MAEPFEHSAEWMEPICPYCHPEILEKREQKAAEEAAMVRMTQQELQALYSQQMAGQMGMYSQQRGRPGGPLGILGGLF
jgi:hypothetical protein